MVCQCLRIVPIRLHEALEWHSPTIHAHAVKEWVSSLPLHDRPQFSISSGPAGVSTLIAAGLDGGEQERARYRASLSRAQLLYLSRQEIFAHLQDPVHVLPKIHKQAFGRRDDHSSCLIVVVRYWGPLDPAAPISTSGRGGLPISAVACMLTGSSRHFSLEEIQMCGSVCNRMYLFQRMQQLPMHSVCESSA